MLQYYLPNVEGYLQKRSVRALNKRTKGSLLLTKNQNRLELNIIGYHREKVTIEKIPLKRNSEGFSPVGYSFQKEGADER